MGPGSSYKVNEAPHGPEEKGGGLHKRSGSDGDDIRIHVNVSGSRRTQASFTITLRVSLIMMNVTFTPNIIRGHPSGRGVNVGLTVGALRRSSASPILL